VLTPWGTYDLGEHDISAGWHEIKIKGPSPLTLLLYETAEHRFIEMTATAAAPACFRLRGGVYQVSVIAGGRPGFYNIKFAQLRRLSEIAKLVILARRLVQHLKQGASLSDLIRKIRNISGKKTVGMRHPANAYENGKLGPHSQFDLANGRQLSERTNHRDRLARLKSRPVFLLRDNAQSISTQAYPHITGDPAAAYDYEIVCDPAQYLTPDALLLFAETIDAHPSIEIVLADVWSNETPTARIAWDPFLYDQYLPRPYALARTAKPVISFANPGRCRIISVPLAVSIGNVHTPATSEITSSRSEPACSVIIPTRDRADLLETCLSGLYENTDWPLEVIVLDNNSLEKKTFEIFEKYNHKGLRVIRAEGSFNFSKLCNIGAAQAQHDYLLFLNNDIRIHRANWLAHMMRFATMQEVGAVGAQLLYDNNRLQHGGIMLGLTQLCGHLWRDASPDEVTQEIRLTHASARSAVTGACLCLEKTKFLAVDGFDAEAFPISLNDVDLCLKLMQRGWHNVYSAHSVLYHLEGESRAPDESGARYRERHAELQRFAQKWLNFEDRYLSAATSRASERYSMR